MPAAECNRNQNARSKVEAHFIAEPRLIVAFDTKTVIGLRQCADALAQGCPHKTCSTLPKRANGHEDEAELAFNKMEAPRFP